MALPYSCIEACSLPIAGNDEWLLFGTSGSKLLVQSSSGASSVWPTAGDSVRPQEPGSDSDGPPGKKIKLAVDPENTSTFSCLTISNDKKHIITVTAEDKCIRVFQVDSKCQLHQLSQRCMARRPCAIAITADDSTILCADKFGDVYALPLIPPPNDGQMKPAAVEERSEAVEEKQYAPSASVLTVHSGRNRKVLEEQLKNKGPKKPKETPPFKHELQLGHVSMLADVAYTTVDGRSYIITADRDEHIRVSRGPPQAHIIEGFCHGHEAFVSRLCLAKSGLLVSGGGDPDLFVWDWLNYRLLQKLSIRDAALQFIKSQPNLASKLPKEEDAFGVAVSGIWSVPSGGDDVNDILVACEGVPALFSFSLGGSSTAGQIITLAGNALDVTFIKPTQDKCIAVVSVDNVHVPGSTTEIRQDEGQARVQYFSYQQGGHWEESDAGGRTFEWFNKNGAQAGADLKPIQSVLYSFENLRKRAGSED